MLRLKSGKISIATEGELSVGLVSLCPIRAMTVTGGTTITASFYPKNTGSFTISKNVGSYSFIVQQAYLVNVFPLKFILSGTYFNETFSRVICFDSTFSEVWNVALPLRYNNNSICTSAGTVYVCGGIIEEGETYLKGGYCRITIDGTLTTFLCEEEPENHFQYYKIEYDASDNIYCLSNNKLYVNNIEVSTLGTSTIYGFTVTGVGTLYYGISSSSAGIDSLYELGGSSYRITSFTYEQVLGIVVEDGTTDLYIVYRAGDTTSERDASLFMMRVQAIFSNVWTSPTSLNWGTLVDYVLGIDSTLAIGGLHYFKNWVTSSGVVIPSARTGAGTGGIANIQAKTT
jgi:hypothetical protein